MGKGTLTPLTGKSVCLPLKCFRKSLEVLEHPLKISLYSFIALEKSLKAFSPLKALVKTIQISLQ